MRTTFVSHGNTLLAPIAGLILCAPKFLAGTMTLGELTQAAAAFTLVQLPSTGWSTITAAWRIGFRPWRGSGDC